MLKQTETKIKLLKPNVQEVTKKWLDLCEKEGLEILVYCTLRTHAEQQSLYEQGRTKPGKIVTNAQAGFSYHNYGVALDFVPMYKGEAQWSNIPLYMKAIKLAESVGFESGCYFKIKDYPHLQYPDGKSLTQLRSEYKK